MKRKLVYFINDSKHWLKQHKKPVSIVSGVVFALIIGGSLLLATKVDQTIERTDPTSASKPSEPDLTFEPSILTGIDVSPDLAKGQITAVMVENSPEARPQSGLVDAGVVYEAIAEGGITRFQALYLETAPSIIGPVRSVRPYYNDWALQFDAALAHVGGSSEALAEIPSLGIKDLDQFRYANAYWKDGSRYATHNTYTSIENLKKIEKQKKFTSSDFPGFPRKEDAPATKPPVNNITVNISSYLYSPVFNYNKANNTYDRVMAGAPHKDRESGKTISPKVVVVLQMDQRVIDGVGRLKYTNTGSNNAWVFQDGNVVKGTWQRTGRGGVLKLLNAAGKQISLNKGQTWFSTLPSGNTVTY